MADEIVHLCHGVQDHYTCHYDGACYGEICIDPKKCSRKWEELTQQEKAYVVDFNAKYKR